MQLSTCWFCQCHSTTHTLNLASLALTLKHISHFLCHGKFGGRNIFPRHEVMGMRTALLLSWRVIDIFLVCYKTYHNTHELGKFPYWLSLEESIAFQVSRNIVGGSCTHGNTTYRLAGLGYPQQPQLKLRLHFPLRKQALKSRELLLGNGSLL